MGELRTLLAFIALLSFSIYFLSSNLTFTSPQLVSKSSQTPDFSRYAHSPTVLTAQQFPIDDPNRRTIIIGDIHGMYKPFRALLNKVRYDPSTDVLLHVGDIIVKAPTYRTSLSTITFMRANNITGVRGNHDQKVIEWRSWIDWVQSFPAGKEWLDGIHRRRARSEAKKGHDHDQIDSDDEDGREVLDEWSEAEVEEIDEWVEKDMRSNKSPWWDKIPEGWKILSQHYNVARYMSKDDYHYLLQLPVALHIPSSHAFIVHAGIVPSDPKRKVRDRRQPLARVPSVTHAPTALAGAVAANEDGGSDDSEEGVLRLLQERAILDSIPPNRDPDNVLNMRSIHHKQVTRLKAGTPWSDVWNAQIDRCAGFGLSSPASPPSSAASSFATSALTSPVLVSDNSFFHINDERGEDDKDQDVGVEKRSRKKKKKKHGKGKGKGKGKKDDGGPLPCKPMTVVYGHAASRGLDIKRWSMGIDSGCVYGNQLSALILSPPEADTLPDELVRKHVLFGEESVPGRLVSVECGPVR